MGKEFNPANMPTGDDLNALKSNIANVVNTVRGFSVNLTTEDRARARSIGNQRYSYVTRMTEAAENYIHVLPRDIDPAHSRVLLSAFDTVKQLQIMISEIEELLDDTRVSIATQLMRQTDQAYAALQQARERDAAIDSLMDEMETFNKRAREEKPEDESPIIE